MTATRIGLVGYGSGGRIFHAPLLASADGVEFAGVVTRSPERRAELAKAHPGVAAYDSLADLAAAGVQAVAISTPAATHVPLAREAVELGLAVVVDKPFALEAAAAREVTTLAGEAGVLLTVYQNRRWDSDLLTLQRLIGEGALGEIRRFESRFERWSPDREPPAAGGGTLLDFGAHLVDQAHLLFGPSTRVYAEMRGDGDRDDDVFVALHHESGVESHLWGSWRQAAPGPRFRVSGTTGTYIVDGIDGQEAALKAGRSPADLGERWGVEPEHAWGRLYRGATGAPVRSERGRWDSFYPAFAAAVRGEGPLPVDPWDSVRNMDVLDAARTSATTGRSVSL
ncbi:Gfo/Idh/MocA family protein [Actinoplanes friuliensis]|jgi:predicted dehydrogenase|uniref:Putative oxidoreductase n=1 Tax=Actinoplanes friuliensis DSM 7358 TaxID=1246995 RepID=U5WAA0_9ACTN|nr:Gfo/Idh/MocA family oxidoreductase [Actinoplanes friuliensis]AGZ44871.1 putative oxidoreductase [Actinoplanes friuliensis DSM 7358]